MSKKLPDGTERERRSFAVPDLRADGEDGIIQGHAAVFEQEANIGGWFIEIIERGAFDKTDFRDVVFSLNHNLQQIPLARSRNNNANSTLQLSIDDAGLLTRASLDTENNSEARALYSAINRGDISGMSFIFAVRASGVFWEGLDTELPIRRIKDIARVYEVSAVSFPAYAGTDIQAARDLQALESAKATLESARSGLVSPKSELELLKAKLKLR
ncbi:HK97 family phage prohead protease [Paenibacillus sp. P96]|uniref:HK97 family phage prohead protease n=1 Tax=Paenibacillus zeirhizosphaerae TaxID=2987519 RepID=A0ABT9FL56_9BACL|nr:HK97 family phage prohead protease [Paenibacillus sp. P96]MDP4095466.1 HK97 family phage prohead protease [Paenibacillus sp. P96]